MNEQIPETMPDFLWTLFGMGEREKLISDVECGRLTPNEAEAIANEKGIGPLATPPDPLKFDPLAEPYWSLPMSMAWIATREISEVRLQWDAYRARYEHWSPEECGAIADPNASPRYSIVTLSRARITPLILFGSRFGKDLGSLSLDDGTPWRAAKDQLWRELQSGELVATGVNSIARQRIVIPASDWLDIDDSSSNEEPARVASNRASAVYSDVLVPRSDVMKKWRGASRTHTAHVIQPISDKELSRAFTKYMMRLGRVPSREEARNWAKTEFGERVTFTRIETLQSEAARRDPRKVGRRPTSRRYT